MNISPARKLRARVTGASETDSRRLTEYAEPISRLAGVSEIEQIGDDAESADAATVIVGEMRVLIPLAGVIDVDAELARLSRQQEKNAADISKLAAKLANPGFTAKAPAHVVEKDRDRLADLQRQNASIDDQLAVLRRLRA
jgi:valyl-tRNA synthetase